MEVQFEDYDVIIIGAGPSGLACAIEAKKNNISYLVIEKGCLVNSIHRFPTNMRLFSTPDLLEIGGIPFIISHEKPSRTELLKYYRIVTEHFLKNIGIEISSDFTPVHDPKSLETNVPGVYIAGVITAGADASTVFIENSRNHGTKIIGHILNGIKN